MIYFITGASGSGKTAAVNELQEFLPDYVIYDFDNIGIPENADQKWRQESTEKWIQEILKDKSQNVCLVGQTVLGEILACPSVTQLPSLQVIYLDCSDHIRVQRIRERNTSPANQHVLNWASWMRMHYAEPRWEQNHIKLNASPIMQFQRWDKLTHWPESITAKVIDTTELKARDVAFKLANIIRDNDLHNRHTYSFKINVGG